MQPFPLSRTLTALVLFGAAFGYVEAAVVVDLRAVYDPLRERVYSGRGTGGLFPLVPPDRLRTEEPRGLKLLITELVREAATLVMLAAVGLGLGHNLVQGFAAFVIGFGLWDLFYYGFLKLLLDWPESLFTWDLLFLIPVPWAAPVLAPVLVAAGMVGAGTAVLWRESTGRPFRVGRLDWLGLVAGGLILVASFCWDYRHWLAGKVPTVFPWGVFALGAAVAGAAFGHAWRSGGGPRPARPAGPYRCPGIS